MTEAMSRRRFRALVFPLAATVGVGFGAILYGFSVLITQRAAGGEFSSGVLSSAFAGSVITGAVTVVLVGRVADRHGIRWVLAVGGLLVGAGFAMFAAGREPWQVLAAWWLLVGPGSAMVLFDPAFIALQQWFVADDRNRAAGTLTLLTGLAGPIFVPATSAGVDAFGWRPTAAVLGALVAVVGWLTAAVALRDAPMPRHAAASRASSAPLRTVASNPAFVLLSLGVLLAMGAFEAVQVHRIARFEETGFAAGTLAFWAAASSLASLPGRFLAPRLAISRPGHGILLAATLLTIPACAMAIRGTAQWEMVGHFLVFGALFGATLPLRTVIMGDWFAGPRFGALMGLQGAAIAVGRSLGPGAVGWLRDLSDGYAAGMVLLTLMVAGSAGFLLAAMRARPTGTHAATAPEA